MAVGKRVSTARGRCDGYLTLQPLPMLWQCPLPLQVGQWHPHAILACGAGRGAGCTISTSTSRSRRRSRPGMSTPLDCA